MFDVDEHVWVIDKSDFMQHCSMPHPKTDRDSLGWDERIIGKAILMFWKASAYKGWYKGKITGYDKEKQEHTIQWDDKTPDWIKDLLACKEVKEW